MASVNAASIFERPLLKGEPGTEDTLAAVAAALNTELITRHVKSTTKAVDGLYTYDVVQRLNDSRFGEGEVLIFDTTFVWDHSVGPFNPING